MAITTSNVYLDTSELNDSKIPSGHSVPTAAASIGTAEFTETKDYTIAFGDFVAATAAAGFDDLLKTELVADIDADLVAATGFSMDATNTIQYNAKVTNIALAANTDLYKNDANRSIVVTVELSVAASA